MKLFRVQGQRQASIDDIVKNGHIDWDERINRAHASETAWKRVTLASLLVAGLGIAGNVYQSATKPGPVVIHVVHDAIGGVVTVASNTPEQEAPTPLMLKSAIEQWVTNCRSIYVDINAMRRTLTACAALIEKGTAADLAMARFYNTGPNGEKQTPFERAATEVVSLDHVVAIPPTSSEIGPQHMQTWAVSWTEKILSRDGSYEQKKPWAANVTFVISPPKDITEVQNDPDGIRIVSWTWTEK